jgi:hypothetical protein
MLGALDHLGVRLQAEPLLMQQIRHRVRGHRMPLRGQLGGQSAGRFRGPPQRRHRVAPLGRLDQRQQRRHQARIELGQPLASRARRPHPPPRLTTGIQLAHPTRHRLLPHPARPRHRRDPAMAQRPRMRPRQQPPLPLIQMRPHLLEHRRQPALVDIHPRTHTASTSPPEQNNA